MRTLLAVVSFSALTVAFFAAYSNYGIPQIEPAPPPEEEKLDLAAMSMDEFIALGGRLYEGRGTCTLCHNEVGGRAPLLEEAAALAPERLADARYQGEAGDGEGYLYESMVDPSAYVVAGFGKSGTGDTESPMPNVASGSVGLSEVEIRAVVAFLQDLGGVEVTVDIPSETVEEEEEAGEPRPPFATPEEAMAEFACGACHKVAGEEGELGPDLTAVGARLDKDHLRRSILLPNADIAEGFEADMMPDDYGEQLYAVELEMLVDYLAGLK
ncbi:MAG: c-type cytochrome [Alphaproteobacteria bacterium]